MSDPTTIAGEIETITRKLGECATALHTATIDLADAEIAYEDAFEGELAVLVEEYEALAARLPGEEVRRALIHKRIDRELYRSVKRLRGRQEALEKYGRLKGQQLSGLQSELSMLRAEAAGPTLRAEGHVYGRRAA